MRFIFPFALLTFGLSFMACHTEPSKETVPEKESRFQESTFEHSLFVDAKKYEVFLPPSYPSESAKQYPVIYMMDRQNLFVDSLAYGGHGWRIHQVLDSLVQAEALREVILVGIDHASEKRFSEYMPQKPAETLPEDYRQNLRKTFPHPIYSDAFLKFLTQELKPHIDSTYRTLPDARHTFLAGSSMGGLISMYALCEYPDVFGGAMCLSTHWPVALDDSKPKAPAAIIDYFAAHLPQGKKWYFDYGTEGIDRFYEPYQLRIDSILQAHGYQADATWMTRKYEGHDHNEKYWYQRVATPLTFVVGKE